MCVKKVYNRHPAVVLRAHTMAQDAVYKGVYALVIKESCHKTIKNNRSDKGFIYKYLIELSQVQYLISLCLTDAYDGLRLQE